MTPSQVTLPPRQLVVEASCFYSEQRQEKILHNNKKEASSPP